MINFDEIFERIKLATNTGTQVELAEVLDIRQSSISDAKRRNSVPSDWYMKLFEQFGLNPDWLKKGSGPMYLRTEQGYVPMDAPVSVGLCEDVSKYSGPDAKNLIVSVHSTQVAPEGSEENAPVLGRLNIPQSFACTGLYVVRTDAAGMEPHIRKGAFVGIDRAQRQVTSGEIYAIRLPYEGLVLKRAYLDSQNSRLILRSEDATHPELSLPLDGHDEYIVGRIIWVLQRM